MEQKNITHKAGPKSPNIYTRNEKVVTADTPTSPHNFNNVKIR